jgi:hypothetical protein
MKTKRKSKVGDVTLKLSNVILVMLMAQLIGITSDALC